MAGDRNPFFSRSMIPAVICGGAVFLVLLYIVDIIIISRVGVESISHVGFFVDLWLTIGFCIGILNAGIWLKKSNVPTNRYSRIGMWFLVGMVIFAAIEIPQLLVWSPRTIESFFGGTRRAIALGGLCGLIFGIIEAGAIEREKDAEREATRAEEAESRREQLSYLNALLRHEVLNTVHVINSYATKLQRDNQLDRGSRSDIDTIQQRAEDMTEVIRDMKVLIRANQEPDNRKAINLKKIVEAELANLRELNADVEVNTSIPDDIYVEADEVVHRVFSNLFANAVEHNDSEIPRVNVIAEAHDETVTVSVADNGPGVPDDKQDALFEPNDNLNGAHGLGLYLVRTLVERYGGKVFLSDVGVDGSTFTVELPTVEDVGSAAVSPPATASKQAALDGGVQK